MLAKSKLLKRPLNSLRRSNPTRSCPPEVIAGLQALSPRARQLHMASYLSDQIMYAEIGRDRHELTMDWVTRTSARIETMAEFFGPVTGTCDTPGPQP